LIQEAGLDGPELEEGEVVPYDSTEASLLREANEKATRGTRAEENGALVVTRPISARPIRSRAKENRKSAPEMVSQHSYTVAVTIQ
jgi:hypothetical protein